MAAVFFYNIPILFFHLKKHHSSLGVWMFLFMTSPDFHIDSLNVSLCSIHSYRRVLLICHRSPSLLFCSSAALSVSVRLRKSMVKLAASKKTVGGYNQSHRTGTTCQQIKRQDSSSEQTSTQLSISLRLFHPRTDSRLHTCTSIQHPHTSAEPNPTHKRGQMHTVPFFCQFL